MPGLGPFSSPLWVGLCALLLALLLGAGALRLRARRAHRRSFARLSLRLGLQLRAGGRDAHGMVAGRELAIWAEDAQGSRLTCVRVELADVFPGGESVSAELLEAWAAAAPDTRASAGPAALGARVAQLLEEARVQALLLAFQRANLRTWIEAGQLHAQRDGRSQEQVRLLEAFVVEALSLAVALSAAVHGPQQPQRERTG